MDGINTHMVGSGPVKFDFVQHPPNPEPSVGTSLRGLGTTYNNLGQTKMSWRRLTPTLVVSGMSLYAGMKTKGSDSKKLLGLGAASLLLGSLWSMS